MDQAQVSVLAPQVFLNTKLCPQLPADFKGHETRTVVYGASSVSQALRLLRCVVFSVHFAFKPHFKGVGINFPTGPRPPTRPFSGQGLQLLCKGAVSLVAGYSHRICSLCTWAPCYPWGLCWRVERVEGGKTRGARLFAGGGVESGETGKAPTHPLSSST